MVDISIYKEKYRNPNRRLLRRNGVDPPEGTWVYSGGKFKAKSANQGSKSKVKTLAPRRRAYGPW